MGIRETINEKRAIVTGVAIGATGLAVVFCCFQLLSPRDPSSKAATSAYFSDDDGATFFTDSSDRIPPFDHGGKQAVAAFVFRCKSGPPFIGYLQRYTQKGAQELQAQHGTADLQPGQTEVSAPLKGENSWVKSNSKAAAAITEVHCPDGSMDYLSPVEP